MKRTLVAVLFAGTLAGAGAAGASASMIADNGFRPNPNGFSFENYGNDTGYQNLTSSEMQRLFGPSVCQNHASQTTPEPAPAPENGGTTTRSSSSAPSGTAFPASTGFAADPTACNLTSDAQAWMNAQNKEMAGGHCNGFAVLAQQLYKQQSPFDPFGPGATFSYRIQGDSQLQRAIAYGFVYQVLPSVLSKRLRADANTILAKLQTALTPSNRETYTLGIYKPNGRGGHAITPYAIEDLGGGMKAIDVYDNNYPNEARQVLVNTKTDTWSYSGASNPAEKQDLYGPGPTDPNLEIDPTTPGLGIQPTQFGKANGSLGVATPAADAGSVKAPTFDTVTLGGSLQHHAHLLIADGPGHRVGYAGGQLVNTFPGAIVRPVLQFNDFGSSPEPTYLIPARNVRMTIDGTSLTTQSDTETLSDVGDGQDVVVQNIKVNPGQRDALRLIKGATDLTFAVASGRSSGSPTLRIGADSSKADVALSLKLVKLRPGATVHVQINQSKQLITFSSAGNPGRQTFVLSAVKQTRKATFVEGSDTVTLRGGQSVTYSYAK